MYNYQITRTGFEVLSEFKIFSTCFNGEGKYHGVTYMPKGYLKNQKLIKNHRLSQSLPIRTWLAP